MAGNRVSTGAKASAAKSAPAKSARKPAAKKQSASGTSQTDPAVIEFLRDLEHPLKREVEVLRELILDVGPEVREGIKWNAPSFRTKDFFATFNLHAKDRVRLILHRGAKKTDAPEAKIHDPKGLLEWLGKDRAMVSFQDANEVRERSPALRAVLREWVAQLPK